MNKQFKDILSFLLRFGFSAGLLWLLFRKIDMIKTTETLKTANIPLIAAAGVIFILLNFILLWRWLVFIRALGITAPLLNVVRYFFVGLFGNLFLPSAIGGDLIKILGLCRDHPSQRPKVVASVLLDRLSGYAGLVIVATVAFTFGFWLINDLMLAMFIFGLAIIWIGMMTVLFNERIYSFGCRIFGPFPKIKNAVMQMHYDIALLKNKIQTLLKAVGLSCLTQVTFALIFSMVAHALHQPIDIVYFLIFVPLICVAASFPSIGGLGVREFGTVYLLGKIGIDSGIAMSISLISFLYMVCVGLLGGLIYVLTLSAGRIQHHQPDPSISPKKA